jgi:hypothetical protein
MFNTEIPLERQRQRLVDKIAHLTARTREYRCAKKTKKLIAFMQTELKMAKRALEVFDSKQRGGTE